jgi:hypothetical protein
LNRICGDKKLPDRELCAGVGPAGPAVFWRQATSPIWLCR